MTTPDRQPIRLGGICLDCEDAEEMAAFYCRVLGFEVAARDTPDTQAGGSGWIALRAPDGGPGLSFQAEPKFRPPTWPEAGDAQQKMMHFEVAADDVDAAVAEVIDAGGQQAPHQPLDRDPSRLRVMLDPAGHPFCLVDAEDFA